jgi:hypothetical protein
MPNSQQIQQKNETVIIVHGTWAKPEPGAVRWYQPPLGDDPEAQGFTTKLDTALKQRGSRARCWAHCSGGDQLFEWSGENSWTARTRAAAALASYISKLQNSGWLCHIIAHSHGGNVVLEALLQMLDAVHSISGVGKITTLGTPFIDTRSPIVKERREAHSLRRIALYMGRGLLIVLVAALLFGIAEDGIVDFFTDSEHAGFIFFTLLLSIGVLVHGRRPQSFGGLTLDDILPWSKANQGLSRVARMQLQLLSIGSRMDEAWQILHHIRNTYNPLRINRNLAGYLFTSLRTRMSSAAETDAIIGAESFRHLKLTGKVVYILSWIGISFSFLVWIAVIGEALFFTKEINFIQACGLVTGLLFLGYFGSLVTRQTDWQTFYSASGAPFRWYSHFTSALLQMPNDVVTYFVRQKSWSVLVAISMGLEGYRFELPLIEQRPDLGPGLFVIYEDLPKGAEQRALDGPGLGLHATLAMYLRHSRNSQ